MDNLQIIQEAVTLLASGQNIALVTVVSTVGSTPGKPGYAMLVWADGQQICGTVGGGAVEAEMISHAAGLLPTPRRARCQFNLGETPQDEKGICGGTVELLVETFDPAALPLFRDLADVVALGDPALLVSTLSPEGVPHKRLVRNADMPAEPCPRFSAEVLAGMRRVAAGSQDAVKMAAGDSVVFIERIARPPGLVLFGAGHLAFHIARCARAVHFHVTVCDDRPEYVTLERFPDADRQTLRDFKSLREAIPIDAHTYVVIVTRGHQQDEIVLEQVLRTEARYIGMIGSQRKTRTILDRLRQRGVSPEQLDRVYSPVGLAIGAVTPEEISLSIVSELVTVRRRGHAAHAGHMALHGPGGTP